MSTQSTRDDMIERPDGSVISYSKLDPVKQLEHDLVMDLCSSADVQHANLTGFKSICMAELPAHREFIFEKYNAKIGGKEGNMTRRSVCGTRMIKYVVGKQTSFGSELESAKALIDEFLDQELVGSKETIQAIVGKVFKVNTKGRVDTQGILGLRDHKFDDPLWDRAMEAIEDAIVRDKANTYIHFYHIDTETGDETRVPLDFAKV